MKKSLNEGLCGGVLALIDGMLIRLPCLVDGKANQFVSLIYSRMNRKNHKILDNTGKIRFCKVLVHKYFWGFS